MENKKYDIVEILIKVCAIVFGISLLQGIFYPQIYDVRHTEDSSYHEWLKQISENCGSTHITYGNPVANGKWYVFTEVCKEDGYCKYEYILVEDCLK